MNTIPTLINSRWTMNLLPHRAELMNWPFWEKERLAAMYDAIRPGDNILDIGTEQGDMSSLFASWAGSNGHIILVEPSIGFWPNIKATFEANNIVPAMCFQVLAGNQTDKDWQFNNDNGLWPLVAQGETSANEIGFTHLNEKNRVLEVKIDDMHLPHIDIITMDIEGSEYEALQGAEQTILKDKPILFISVHPEFMWREHHHSPDDLHVMLNKWGYDATYLAFDHEQHWIYKPRPA